MAPSVLPPFVASLFGPGDNRLKSGSGPKGAAPEKKPPVPRNSKPNLGEKQQGKRFFTGFRAGKAVRFRVCLLGTQMDP